MEQRRELQALLGLFHCIDLRLYYRHMTMIAFQAAAQQGRSILAPSANGKMEE